MAIYQGHNSGGNHNYNAYFYDNCQWYLHFHKNYELAFVLDGKTELTLNGRTMSLEQGSFALILPNEFHAYRTMEHSRVWIAVFSADFVSSFDRMMKSKQAKVPVFTCSQPVLDFLRQRLITQQKLDVLMLKSALYAVCSEFLNQVNLVDMPRDVGFVEQTIAFVAENFRNEISLQDLAQAFGYEYHYLSRQFHRHFPMHFKQFLNVYRTEFARDQLLYTDRSITDIALEAGFQNSRSFNRVFLEQMSMTPTKFRSSRQLTDPVDFQKEPLP